MFKLQDCLISMRDYLRGSVFIYMTLQKICDIVKILEQKNNFTLKLNSYKPEIEASLNSLKELRVDDNDPVEVENRMSDLPIK